MVLFFIVVGRVLQLSSEFETVPFCFRAVKRKNLRSFARGNYRFPCFIGFLLSRNVYE